MKTIQAESSVVANAYIGKLDELECGFEYYSLFNNRIGFLLLDKNLDKDFAKFTNRHALYATAHIDYQIRFKFQAGFKFQPTNKNF